MSRNPDKLTPATVLRMVANQIEQNPESYNFHEVTLPDCGSPGCLLGWAGVFMGKTAEAHYNSAIDGLFYNLVFIAEGLGFKSDADFYHAMGRATEYSEHMWEGHAPTAAKGLRRLAEEMEPAYA